MLSEWLDKWQMLFDVAKYMIVRMSFHILQAEYCVQDNAVKISSLEKEMKLNTITAYLNFSPSNLMRRRRECRESQCT